MPGAPIMISGDCKRETGQEHAKIITTLLRQSKNAERRPASVLFQLPLMARRDEDRPLVQLTFKKKLEETSPIYSQLKDLQFMDFHVGDDDVTADKDWKHVAKRLRNYLLRARGIVVRDVRIHQEKHINCSGVSSTHPEIP